MRFVLIGAICGSMLLSDCIATRSFDQIEREMNESPVRATFSIPPPCEYVPSPLEPSALVGTWSVSGTMDGVDYSPRYIPPKNVGVQHGKILHVFVRWNLFNLRYIQRPPNAGDREVVVFEWVACA